MGAVEAPLLPLPLPLPPRTGRGLLWLPRLPGPEAVTVADTDETVVLPKGRPAETGGWTVVVVILLATADLSRPSGGMLSEMLPGLCKLPEAGSSFRATNLQQNNGNV